MKISSFTALTVAAVIAFSSAAWAGGQNERAATNWLVIFNNTDGCATSPCSEADIVQGDFTIPDEPVFTGNAAEVAICYLTGQVIQANGRATFAASFAAGQNYDCFHPFDFGKFGLVDDTAEVHIVLQEHGAALETGEGLEDQVAYFLGECNPDCNDTQFAIHLSDVTGTVSNVPMQRFSDASEVKGSSSTLLRQGGGIRVISHTRIAR